MRTPLIMVLTSLSVMPSITPKAALAQGFEGTVVDLQYQRYDLGASELDSLEGRLDAAWAFGTFGAQLGLTIGKDVDNSGDINFRSYNGLALHATADVSDSLRLGAMLAADSVRDEVYVYAAEALYMAGPLRVEGRIGDSLEDDERFSLFEAKGAYSFGALSARAGLHQTSLGGGASYGVFSIGAGYAIGDTAEVYADIGRHKTDNGTATDRGNVINLGVRFDLGGDSSRMFTYEPLK